MKLSDLIKNISHVKILGNSQIDISNIEFDSRNVIEGSLFIALKGSTSDGHNYIETAIEKGAKRLYAKVCQFKKREFATLILWIPVKLWGLLQQNITGTLQRKSKL